MSNIPLMSDGRNFSTWEQPINMDFYLQIMLISITTGATENI